MNSSSYALSLERIHVPTLYIRSCEIAVLTPRQNLSFEPCELHRLYCVVAGECALSLQKESYLANCGDVILLPPNESASLSCGSSHCRYVAFTVSGPSVDMFFRHAGLVESKLVASLSEGESFLKEFERQLNSFADDSDYAKAVFITGKIYELASRITNLQSSTANFSLSEKIIAYFSANLGENISISRLATAHGFSRTHFTLLFKNETGVSPKQYLLNLRMKQANALLQETDLDIKTISRQVGYDDPLLFSKQFKNKMGVSPSNLRKSFSE